MIDYTIHTTIFNLSCDKDTTEECMLKCMVESYMSSCSCVPLKYYYYSYGETSLCDGTCHAKTSCEEECNRNYCSLQLYELAKTAYNNLISPLFTIEINTQTPHFHQVFETEYVTGQSQLVYTIIGHLELWLGFNIIAVLHVIVYMCKKLASYVRKRRNIIQSTEYKTETDWKSVQGELSKISQSISSEIKRLERQNNVRNSWKKRFKWLHRNKFFDETPLSGFSFVSNAKTIVEVLLWYSVLCLFVGLMLYNVTGLLNSYLSRPTKRHVLTMQNNIQFENMTITIELPFIEFITTSLLKDRFKKMIKITNTQTKSSKLPWLNQYLACYVIDPQLLNYHAHNYYHEQRIRFVESHCIDIVKGKWKTASQNVKDENLPGVPDISCRKMLNLWKKKLSEGAANVLEYLLSNYNATTDSLLDPSNIVPTLTTMEGLLDGPLKWREQYAAFKFMLLASLEQAFDPIAKLAAISLQWMINMDTYTPSYNNAENYLKMLDINSSQLLRSVQTELGKTLHVDIVNIEGARVFLRQWNYSTTSIYQDFQTVSLELFLPANVTELRIEIRSFMRMWQRYLLGAFSHYFDYLAQHHPDYYQAQVRCDSGQLLHDPSKERDLIRDEQMLSDYNFETAIPTIILQPHGRPKLGVRHDEYITEILAQPSFQFLSQTDQCSMEPSNQACIEKCVNKLYGNICKCYPWGLYYLNQDSTTNVCTKPCKKADFESRKNKCEEECDKAQERPCKLNMYSMVEADPTTKVLKPTDDPLDQPMYILSLKFANNMFPQYIEEYSMKFTDFLSELGGILEFWLGINIVALLHLGVFLVKFCNEKRRTTGKGKSEKSTETEASKETQEIRKFEQEVNDEMQYLQDEIQKKIGQY